MSRNAEKGFELYQELYKKGVELIFLKENYINTSTYKQALNQNVALTGTNVDVMKIIGVSRNSYYKYKKKSY